VRAAARSEWSELRGHTTPRLYTPELRELTPSTSLGYECIAFLEDDLGWELYPWQRWLYIHALELDETGTTFRFDTIVIEVARQNGKTRWLLGLVLWRLYVDMARLVISSAQDLDKAEELLEEGYELIAEDPELGEELVKYVQINGKRRIDLTPVDPDSDDPRLRRKRRWKAQTSTRKAGRSLSVDLAILDELREHQKWDAWNAIAPTTTAIRRSQVVAVSNAGDNTSVVLRSLRTTALRRIETGQTADTKVGWFEWSAPDGVPYRDPQYWPYANPSLGYSGMTVEKLAGFADGDEAGFRTEHLCQWVAHIEPGVFPQGSWEACRDPESRRDPDGRFALALDVSWNRAWSYITIAALREDGLVHLELVAARAGTDWVADWFRQRLHKFREVVIQARGAPASSLIGPLREVALYDEDGSIAIDDEGKELCLNVIEWGGSELAVGSGQFFDAVVERKIRHRGQPRLSAAAELAKSKPSGDAWIFERKNSAGDTAPVVAGVAAVWRLNQPVEDPGTSAYDDYDDDELIFA